MEIEELSKLILNKRLEMDKTQKAFGEIVGVRQQAVQRWEDGAIPGKSAAKKLAKILDIRISDIEGLREKLKREKITGEQIVNRTAYSTINQSSGERLSSRERYLIELLREDDCPLTVDQIIKIILDKK